MKGGYCVPYLPLGEAHTTETLTLTLTLTLILTLTLTLKPLTLGVSHTIESLPVNERSYFNKKIRALESTYQEMEEMKKQVESGAYGNYSKSEKRWDEKPGDPQAQSF